MIDPENAYLAWDHGDRGYDRPVVCQIIHDDKRCTWIENEDGVWETECNELFEFNSTTTKKQSKYLKNKVKYANPS